jgi:TRAP-type C4-dicarboxylate transport system substrate-binding protein
MKKATISMFLVLIALGLIVNTSPALAAGKPVKIKYAHFAAGKPLDSFVHAAAVAFKNVVEKRSGGKYEVVIYPSGTLGKEIDMMEAVRNNVIQIHGSSSGGLYRIFPESLLIWGPYVFRNPRVGEEVVEGPFGRKLLDLFTEKTGIKGLAIQDIYGSDYINNSVRPIRKPADMKGIKFRAMDTLQVTHSKALGATAIQVPFAEVYTALHTGVVEGTFMPTFLIRWGKFYEVMKYMTRIDFVFGNNWIVCNKQWYDGLPRKEQLMVRDAAKAAVTASRGIALIKEPMDIAYLKEKGMEITTLTEEEALEFKKVAQGPILDWLRTQIDPKLVDELLEVTKETERKLGY